MAAFRVAETLLFLLEWRRCVGRRVRSCVSLSSLSRVSSPLPSVVYSQIPGSRSCPGSRRGRSNESLATCRWTGAACIVLLQAGWGLLEAALVAATRRREVDARQRNGKLLIDSSRQTCVRPCSCVFGSFPLQAVLVVTAPLSAVVVTVERLSDKTKTKQEKTGKGSGRTTCIVKQALKVL